MTPSEKLRPLQDQKTLVQFVASASLMEKLEELKHLLAHQNFEGRMDVLVEQLADLALKKLKPASHAVREPTLTPTPGPTLAPNPSPAPGMNDSPADATPPRATRYIRAPDRRAVLRNYSQGCAYQDPRTGRTCGSRHGLQIDHRRPLALGGRSEAANLRLLCGAHNRWIATQMGLRHPKLA